jgi:hypothetical protein
MERESRRILPRWRWSWPAMMSTGSPGQIFPSTADMWRCRARHPRHAMDWNTRSAADGALEPLTGQWKIVLPLVSSEFIFLDESMESMERKENVQPCSSRRGRLRRRSQTGKSQSQYSMLFSLAHVVSRARARRSFPQAEISPWPSRHATPPGDVSEARPVPISFAVAARSPSDCRNGDDGPRKSVSGAIAWLSPRLS